jgi:hypothetical protein
MYVGGSNDGTGRLLANKDLPNAGRKRTVLYEIVRDNIDTLYGAIDDGALDVGLPKHAIKGLGRLPQRWPTMPRLRAGWRRAARRR